jgi:hypothetical protein
LVIESQKQNRAAFVEITGAEARRQLVLNVWHLAKASAAIERLPGLSSLL